MNRKKVTSTDVAKRAGVSQATVSMVLNQKYNVSFSRETIKKVNRQQRSWDIPMRKSRVPPEYACAVPYLWSVRTLRTPTIFL